VADGTVTDVFGARAGDAAAWRARTAIVVALRAGAPSEAPSRHLLDDVDVVVFGRGPRAAVRDVDGGLRRLRLRVPDPVMSSDHGRLLGVRGVWLLEDPRSKNGALVSGTPTRSAMVRPGDAFVLGHTVFLLERGEHPADAPLDVTAREAPVEGAATLHPSLHAQVELLLRVAPSDVPLLLLGETGTGKEVFARAAHALSGRRGAFVAVNCGALAPGLVEAELFGHRRGAFTGAVADRPGYLRSARGGTVFLDEIAELPAPAQAVLLRALQQREVVPVGDTAPVAVDFRLVAATHRDLGAMVASGAFRADLHARLLGLTLVLPPLRERRCDLGLLVASILRRLGATTTFTPAAAYALFRHQWPLNVRELERCLATALPLAGGRPVDAAHLRLPAPAAAAPAPPVEDDDGLRGSVTRLLVEHRGNVAAVARDLGKHREQVHRWIRRWNLDLDSFKRP
jgi:DNA-binding NtrC family response regulator